MFGAIKHIVGLTHLQFVCVHPFVSQLVTVLLLRLSILHWNR